MPEFLKNLNINKWYKVLIYLGLLLFMFSLFIDIKWLTNKEIGLLGLAFLFIGLGEWKNEKVAIEFKQPNAYTGPACILQYPIRKPDVLGWCLLIVGFVFLVLFLREVL
ncbi:MAG: hypothetical protein PHO28_04600 [Candidatus Pacebacteria bacterium]|nr:hypothetical protein [Candidatus Paceibacterota bacterium]